ncbi:MAG: hypothetical protein ABUS79_13880 [Pseudomonadota bacterium]
MSSPRSAIVPPLVAAVSLALAFAGAAPGCAQSEDVMPGGPARGTGGEGAGTGGGSGGRSGAGTGGGGGAAGTTPPPSGTGGASGGAGARVTAGSGGGAGAEPRSSGGSTGAAGTRAGSGSGGAGGRVTSATGGAVGSGGTVGSGGSGGAAATFTQVYKMILNVPTSSPSNCAGSTCHIPGSGQAHVKFDTQANAYQTLRSVAIIPGNATGSILYTNLATGVMPDNRPMISDALLQLVESWINAGALNN